MKQLPDTVTRYSETPEFTAETLPAKLRGLHDTKAGVWGRIELSAGQVTDVIEPQNGAIETHQLTPDRPGIVEPAVPHRVSLSAAARMRVGFYR